MITPFQTKLKELMDHVEAMFEGAVPEDKHAFVMSQLEKLVDGAEGLSAELEFPGEDGRDYDAEREVLRDLEERSDCNPQTGRQYGDLE